MSDPIVLKWEQEGLASLLRVLERLDDKLEKVDDDVEKVDKTTKKYDQTTKKLGNQTRQTARNMAAFGDAISGVNTGAGRATRSAGRLLGVFSRLGTAGGATGLAIAGGATAVFAMAGASLMAVKSLTELAARGREAATELKPFSDAGFFEAFDESQLARFDRIGASFDAIKTTAKGAGLAFADEFAPELERATIIMVAFGIAIADNVEGIGRFIRGLGGIASTAAAVIQAIGPLARGALVLMTNGLSEAIVVAGEFADGLDDTEGATGDYIARAKGLIGEQDRVNRSLRGGASAASTLSSTLDALGTLSEIQFQGMSDSLDPVLAKYIAIDRAAQKQISTIESLAAAHRDNAAVQEEAALARLVTTERVGRDMEAVNEGIQASEQEARDKAYEKGVANLEALGGLYDTWVSSALDAATDTTGAISSLASTLSTTLVDEGSKGAIALFRINQAAALANIGVLTAVAVMRGLAGPTPIASSIAAAAVGAASAAQVVTQQPPQVQAHGGMDAGAGGTPLSSGRTAAPDEYDSGNVRRTAQEMTVDSTGRNEFIAAAKTLAASMSSPPSASIGRRQIDRELSRSIDSNTSGYSQRLKRKTRAASRGVGSW
jgi:hypothetical protein